MSSHPYYTFNYNTPILCAEAIASMQAAPLELLPSKTHWGHGHSAVSLPRSMFIAAGPGFRFWGLLYFVPSALMCIAIVLPNSNGLHAYRVAVRAAVVTFSSLSRKEAAIGSGLGPSLHTRGGHCTVALWVSCPHFVLIGTRTLH